MNDFNIFDDHDVVLLEKIMHQWLWEASVPTNWNNQNVIENLDQLPLKDQLIYIKQNNLL